MNQSRNDAGTINTIGKDDERIAIVGDGQMGLVTALILDSRGVSCTIWGRSRDRVTEVKRTRESQRHLPGHRLSDSIELTSDDQAVFERATMILNAVPTQYIRPIYTRLKPHIPPGIPIVSVSKGIETATLLLPTQIISAVADGAEADRPPRPLAALSGPSIADELAQRLPATLIAASNDEAFAARIQAIFSTKWIRIYTNRDLLGVELAGATKNVIALAAGIVDGLEAGINAKSALLARGLAEITRLGVVMGAKADTFFGIAGVGDLATTCFSPLGRNRSCGERLGRGAKLADILESTDSVVEGVPTTRAVMTLAEQYDVEMPLTAAVYAILFEDLDPRQAISKLMMRTPKAERIG